MSLRTRLLLLVAAVVVASLASVAIYSREMASRTFVEVSAEGEVSGSAPRLDDLAETLGRRLARRDTAGWNEALRSLEEPLLDTHWLLLFDSDRQLVAGSDPVLAEASIAIDDRDLLTIERRGVGDDGGERVELLELQAPLVPLRDDVGAVFAWLTALPRPATVEAGAIERRAVFRASLGRNLLFGVAVVGLLALLATHLVARRVLGPVGELTAGARRMARGEFGTRVAIDRDDELGELGTAFNEMAEALGAIERWRQHLLDDTAHELRTPLTNLRCRIEAMEDGLAPTDPPALAELGGEVQRLARLVDDLRDLSLAEAGRLTLDRRPLRLGELARSVLGSLGEAGAAVSLEVRGDDEVDGDPLRLRQVLTNLVANGLAHGRSGVTVSIAGEDRRVLLHVEDRGPGLDDAEIPRLFERFYRAGDRRRDGSGGSGLGLAIVRQLVHAHGGEIAAGNRRGGGARFTVALPRTAPADRPRADPATA